MLRNVCESDQTSRNVHQPMSTSVNVCQRIYIWRTCENSDTIPLSVERRPGSKITVYFPRNFQEPNEPLMRCMHNTGRDGLNPALLGAVALKAVLFGIQQCKTTSRLVEIRDDRLPPNQFRPHKPYVRQRSDRAPFGTTRVPRIPFQRMSSSKLFHRCSF